MNISETVVSSGFFAPRKLDRLFGFFKPPKTAVSITAIYRGFLDFFSVGSLHGNIFDEKSMTPFISYHMWMKTTSKIDAEFIEQNRFFC